MIRVPIFLAASYIAAAPLTARISLNPSQTEWLHWMTYFWLAVSLAIWTLLAVIIGLAAVWRMHE